MKPTVWWIIIPIVFTINTALQTTLAWRGSNFALIMLAVTCLVLVAALGVYAYGWRDALNGWGRATTGWGAAQEWGMKQDEIMRDVLKDLWEYDEEAVEIHSGRSTQASLAYLKVFQEEDAKLITEGVMEELRKEN